ncbi:Gfo/Idh/MocA family protein [Paenibacillus arenilitoris]|uniref:Gfo/Idh/MocA family oxidoreductase n=1 Tax=Paenibacillus arenilitoris TaxID=2772299 RepID=A0A927CLE4_9BACL|nr:Gfo/Idh/MocA family oxidoreductase [Paenibacillus arenilitoris]MBD2868733.1 Gfo/Idh/MocA family oxidoreductase [Paenibacillus arenilitoris]
MKKRYAICGVSGRALGMFAKPILTTFAGGCELVGLLDPDPARFALFRERYPEQAGIRTYGEDDFDRLVEETRPDVIIAAGRDHTHARYIIAALRHGLDVITEKPMVTTGEDSRRVLEAEKASKGGVTVTFNYRYAPIHTRIKELVLEGRLGRITSIDLNWYLDTYHGSSYFKRWNRERELSGGLSVHKSTHHFDLVNWWIGQKPIEAFAYGALNYYGAEAEANPKKEDGRHCSTCERTEDCGYYSRWNARSKNIRVPDDHLGSLAAGGGGQAYPYSDYRPDRCIFDSSIDIEDTYAATVRYDGGALLSYSVNFSLPYEGYRLAINGTKGRLETVEYHMPSRTPFQVPVQTIDYFPLFGSKETIHVVHKEGSHGGGDPLLLEDLFMGEDRRRPYRILSGAEDGAYSVATGEAVWRSAKEHRPVTIAEVLGGGANEREAALSGKGGGTK